MRLNRFNLIIFSSNRFKLIIFNLYMKFSLNLNENRPNNNIIKNDKQNINFNFNFRSKIHHQQQPTPTIDQSIKKINIFTRKCAIISTRNMAKQLEELGIETTINLRNINNKDIEICEKDPNLYLFILFPQWNLTRPGIKIKDLPKNKYFLYQMEQLNQNEQPYQNIDLIKNYIKNSYCTFDYSSTNISLYPDDIRDKIKLLTPFIGEVNEYSEVKTIDILFIGALNNRRIKILDELKKYSRENNLDYKIEIVDNVFEDELDRLIKKCKIVINLHYYPNAILELFRIHDLLPYDCKILSELPGDGDPDGSVEKYKDVVDFFPVIDDDLSNLEDMFELIDNSLNNDNYSIIYNYKKLIEYINNKNNNILSTIIKENNNLLINILIRSTYRPCAFKKCINSVLTQRYKNYRVIMCYDDDNCLEYLNEYKNNDKIEIFKAREVDRSEKAFYNLYCNELLERVKNGWIIFLDDDDMFASSYALKIINSSLNNTNNLLFWKFKRPDRLVYPNINILAKDTIASCGYCFHSKYKDLSQWTLGQQGDYNYINGLVKQNNFNKVFIDEILTKTTFDDMKVGNFGKKELN